MTRKEIADRIIYHATRHQHRPELVAAICLQESELDPDATRFDEKSKVFLRLFSWDRSRLAGYVPPAGKNPSLHDEKVWRGHSWGLMQPLGETARVLGFKARYLPSLIHPDNSLHYGCLYLKKCFDRAVATHPDVRKMPIEHYALYLYNGSKEYPSLIFERLISGEAFEVISL